MCRFATLYLAAAYLIGIVVFLFVLDYPSITEPAQKVTLLVNHRMVFYTTNLNMYIGFGDLLLVPTMTLYERLKAVPPLTIQTATVSPRHTPPRSFSLVHPGHAELGRGLRGAPLLPPLWEARKPCVRRKGPDLDHLRPGPRSWLRRGNALAPAGTGGLYAGKELGQMCPPGWHKLLREGRVPEGKLSP